MMALRIRVRADDRLDQKAGDGSRHPTKLAAIVHRGDRIWARRAKPTFGAASRFQALH